MAITFDATSNSDGITPSSNQVSFTHTIGAGSNTMLVVAGLARDGTVTGVTYNSIALTKEIDRNSANALYSSLWTLAAPSAGSNSVVVTFNTNPTYGCAIACSFFGVAQSSYVDDTDATETTGADPSSLPALTTTTDGCAVIDALATNETVADATMNAETNRVERAKFLAELQTREVAASTIVTKSPAGSVTMGWNLSANGNSSYVGLAIKPAAEAGGSSLPFVMQLGAQRI